MSFCNSDPSTGNLFDWIVATVLDAAILVLTLFRTVKLSLQARKAGLKNTLGYILLRDGTSHFFSLITRVEF